MSPLAFTLPTIMISIKRYFISREHLMEIIGLVNANGDNKFPIKINVVLKCKDIESFIQFDKQDIQEIVCGITKHHVICEAFDYEKQQIIFHWEM